MQSECLRTQDFTLDMGFFPSSARSTSFRADEVHIWTCPLPDQEEDSLSTLDMDMFLLSPDEKERVHRKKKTSLLAAHSLAISRTFLRYVLAHYMREKASDILIKYGAAGKPYVKGGPQFNLSHTQGVSVLAVTAHNALGVDVEYVRPLLHMDAIIKRFLTEDERQYVLENRSDEHETRRRLWHVLTRKEAWIKACGQSLCGRWRSLSTWCAKKDDRDVRALEGQQYVLQSLDVGQGYSASLCVTGNRKASVRWMNTTEGIRR